MTRLLFLAASVTKPLACGRTHPSFAMNQESGACRRLPRKLTHSPRGTRRGVIKRRLNSVTSAQRSGKKHREEKPSPRPTVFTQLIVSGFNNLMVETRIPIEPNRIESRKRNETAYRGSIKISREIAATIYIIKSGRIVRMAGR